MKTTLTTLIFVLVCTLTLAQQPSADTWSNVPKSTDDRYTNPKSNVYAGPNGWWNFGELRAEADPTVKYAFKGGLITNSEMFLLTETGKLQVFHMDFGTENPAPGVYQISRKADIVGKKVFISFADVSGGKIKNWSGKDGSGFVTVSKVNVFTYFKCRNIVLHADGKDNAGASKNALNIGFEGAVKP